MTDLRRPVKRALRDPVTPASVARMWSRIDARGRTPGRSRRPAWAIAAVVLMASAALAAAPSWRSTKETHPESMPQPRERALEAPALRASERANEPLNAPSSALDASVQSTPIGDASSHAPFEAREPAPRTRTSSTPDATAHARWRDLAAHAENAQAYDALGAGGIAREARTASVEDLFALADVARLSGHPAEAVAPLARIMTEHERDPRASLAALTLGRIELRAMGRPNEAAGALDRAVAMGLPAGVSEEAYALRIEALASAGNREAAQRAYDEFTAKFPNSARTTDLARWLRSP